MITFNISQILNADLMSRLMVTDLYNLVKNTQETEITLDFSGVNFATRSFMDEFYNVFIKPANLPFHVATVNMSNDLDAILNAVKTTQDTKKHMSDATVQRTKTLQDVDNYFAALSI